METDAQKRLKIICGALVVKANKFVLVQEAQQHCYGKWSFPAGHLEMQEDIITATQREVKEETNLSVNLDGLVGVYEYRSKRGNHIIKFIFKASVIEGSLRHGHEELLDARWFSFEEFYQLKDAELRDQDMRQVIADYHTKPLKGLDTINVSFF
ncbi:MAG: NUDIX domain-containing protein [Candidatus Woesearchaeota archaeon]